MGSHIYCTGIWNIHTCTGLLYVLLTWYSTVPHSGELDHCGENPNLLSYCKSIQLYSWRLHVFNVLCHEPLLLIHGWQSPPPSMNTRNRLRILRTVRHHIYAYSTGVENLGENLILIYLYYPTVLQSLNSVTGYRIKGWLFRNKILTYWNKILKKQC